MNTSPLRHVPDGDGGHLCECPDSECCPEDRPNPLGPHVQVVKGWLDDNGCLLPDPDGIAYRRTFSDWEQVPDAVTTHEHEWSGWMPGSHGSRYRCCLDPTCDEGEIQ